MVNCKINNRDAIHDSHCIEYLTRCKDISWLSAVQALFDSFSNAFLQSVLGSEMSIAKLCFGFRIVHSKVRGLFLLGGPIFVNVIVIYM